MYPENVGVLSEKHIMIVYIRVLSTVVRSCNINKPTTHEVVENGVKAAGRVAEQTGNELPHGDGS